MNEKKAIQILDNDNDSSKTSTTSSSRFEVKRKFRSNHVSPQPKMKPHKKTSTHDSHLSLNARKKDKVVIVDLTTPRLQDLLPGTPYHSIKNSHSLFFMYDPRGFSKRTLPEGYCRACRCPKNYCAEIVYGRVCSKRVEFLIGEKGTINVNEDVIIDLFEKVYSINISAHLMRNGIKFSEELQMDIPRCMKRQSLKRLIKKVEGLNVEDDGLNWSDYDMTVKELDEFAAKYSTDNTPGERTYYEGRKPCYVVRNLMKEKEGEAKVSYEQDEEV